MSNTDSIKSKIVALLDQIQSTMIAVATGGPRINEVNTEYTGWYNELTKLLGLLGFNNPIPYTDLWRWYGKWSSGDLPTYQSRREYIIGLIEPIKTALRDSKPSHLGDGHQQLLREIEITGWPRVDRTLSEIRTRLESASNEEQFQSIGHLCREALFSLAEIVFDSDQHPPLEEEDVEPSPTDFKRILDRYLVAKVAGGQNKYARKYARASLDLANKLQHNRNANLRDAMLCAEATASVVNFVAIISGKRDPEAATEQPPYKPGPFPF